MQLNLRKSFALFGVMVFYVLVAAAQERVVSGKVTDAKDGSGLPGVNVLLKGTTTGAVSDIDGNYSLDIPSSAGTLIFSSIGYITQEIEIGNQTTIDIAMELDVTQLSEVVVTAIGIERDSRSLGYHVQEINSEAIENRATPDVVRSLNGKIAGVQITGSNGAPGSSTNIIIRGNSTTRNNQPLFVVDGVPYDNSLDQNDNTLVQGATVSNRVVDLDPNNIESVTVLKGGAAAALYGSRAANGAIIVTTKTGSSQAGTAKGLEVSLTSGYTVQEVSKLPDLQNTYGQGADGIFNNGFFGTWGPAFDSEVNEVTDHLGNRVPYQAYPDNVADFYETGALIENSVLIRTGNEDYSFSASYARTDNEGIFPNSDYSKNVFSAGGSVKLTNGFTASGNLTYTNSEQVGIQAGGGGVADGSVHRVLWFVPRSYDLTGYPFIDPNTLENSYYRNGVLNPYWVTNENPFFSDLNRVNGFLKLSYEITEWLTASYQIGFNTYNDRRKTVYAVGNPVDPLGRIVADDITFTEYESNFLLTFAKELNQDFNLRAIVGHNINSRSGEHQQILGSGIIVPRIYQLDNTNNLLKGEFPLGGDEFQRRLWGVFADVQLSYQNKAYLNFTGRNDWSSTLPSDNQSFFYPSVSGSVMVSEFIDMPSQYISFAKVRAAWARVGNDASPFSLVTIFRGNENIGTGALDGLNWPFGGVSSITVGNTEGNPDLKPEFTNEIELGLDLGFWNDRINLSVTWYKRNTTDLITNVTLPATSGFLGRFINAGEIENRGWELTLDATPVQLGNGFNWNILANFTRNRNEVISLAQDQEQIDLPGSRFFSRGQVLRVGEPYGLIEGRALLRDDEGNLLINQDEGLPIGDPNVSILGDPNPDFLLGVTNTFTYKGLSLGFLVDARVGGDMFIGTIRSMRARGVLDETGEDRNRSFLVPGVLADDNLQPLLDESGQKVPNNIYVDANSYFFQGPVGFGDNSDEPGIFDVTTIRLRELSLSYNFPKSLFENTPIGSARISFIGRNLWFTTPNLPDGAGVDPEASGLSAANQNALIVNYIPTTKSYGVNLNVTF
ncbi:MAG: SusC/RagA family TonB-linked outer membrane protein [Cytophagales bacterium]|nr:SusC/RagA family TonB-linked outer membrane protein [Cytophagales bacterium]